MKEKILNILSGIREDVNFVSEKSMIDDGILESFDVIQIVSAIMNEFDIFIDADDIEPENLNSLEAIYSLVERKKSEKS